MELVILIIHLVVCICLIGLVLLQRSEGGALGMGGGGSGALMSGRGAADALAKMTSVAGGFFLVTSLGLTMLSGAASSSTDNSILDAIQRTPAAPITAPLTTAPPATDPAATPAQPDPTESSAPQATDTRLASIMPGPAAAAASPPPATGVRAGPLAASTGQPATTQRTTPPSTTARTVPASTGNTATVTPRQTPPQRTANATNQAGNGTSQTGQRPLVIPNTSGAVTGIALADDPAQQTESIQIGDGSVEAVRRERAGPDQ